MKWCRNCGRHRITDYSKCPGCGLPLYAALRETQPPAVSKVESVRVDPGDVLVVSLPEGEHDTERVAAIIEGRMKEHFPNNKVMVLGAGMKLTVVKGFVSEVSSDSIGAMDRFRKSVDALKSKERAEQLKACTQAYAPVDVKKDGTITVAGVNLAEGETSTACMIVGNKAVDIHPEMKMKPVGDWEIGGRDNTMSMVANEAEPFRIDQKTFEPASFDACDINMMNNCTASCGNTAGSTPNVPHGAAGGGGSCCSKCGGIKKVWSDFHAMELPCSACGG